MSFGLEGLRSELLDTHFERAQEQNNHIDWQEVIRIAKEQSVPEALAAISMSADLLDYFGQFAAAKGRLNPVAAEAERRLRSLVEQRKGRPRSNDDRKVLKCWVWILIQQAMVSYREIQFDRALRLLRICEDAILGAIRAIPGYPCSGTLARINYSIGLVYRERFDFASAKKEFLKSIEFSWKSVREKSDKIPGKPFQQPRWTDLAIAKSLALGLGFVYHSEGQPDLALPVLLSAKNLLARLEENLISTYVDLIYFDARRSAYGEDQAIVDESITGLERCYALFLDFGHDLYRARAVYSLALAFSQRARPDETKPLATSGEHDLKRAEKYADELMKYGVESSDPRAEAYSMLCRSRIERKRNHFLEAQSLATDTMRVVGDAHAHVYVSALIARAEAFLRLDKTNDALSDFHEAAERAMGNLRARAICLLRMAEIHAKKHNSRLASRCFEEWKQISPQISNAYLRRLECAAQTAIEAISSDFIVRVTDDHLDPEDLERRLHGFLARWAAPRSKSDQQAAALLGISRQTLVNWRGGDDRST